MTGVAPANPMPERSLDDRTGLTADERRLRAQAAVHTSWANTVDRTARTAAASVKARRAKKEAAVAAAHTWTTRGRPPSPVVSDLALHLADEHGVTTLMLPESAKALHRALHLTPVEALVAYDHPNLDGAAT